MQKGKILLSVACVGVALSALLAGAGEGAPAPALQVGRALDLTLGDGVAVVQSMDSHGGFHGDGLTYIELGLDVQALETLQKGLEANAEWHKTPLSEDAACVFYGSERVEGGVTVSRTAALPEGTSIPAVADGWWLLRDRQEGGSGPVFIGTRASCNFTAALLDPGRGRLYYVALDT